MSVRTGHDKRTHRCVTRYRPGRRDAAANSEVIDEHWRGAQSRKPMASRSHVLAAINIFGEKRDLRSSGGFVYYIDDDGPIWVRLPKEGLDHMCGHSVSAEDVELVLRAREKELPALVNRVVDRCNGFTKENGAQFRKFDISMADITDSGIKLSTDFLALKAGFFFPRTGIFPQRR